MLHNVLLMNLRQEKALLDGSKLVFDTCRFLIDDSVSAVNKFFKFEGEQQLVIGFSSSTNQMRMIEETELESIEPLKLNV